MAKEITAKDKGNKEKLDYLWKEATEQSRRAEAAETDLSKRIDSLKNETDAALDEAKKLIAAKVENVYSRATRYVDRKTDGAKAYADELRDGLVSQLEERISALAAILDSLDKKTALLRDELDEQKKKLNFYANIEEDAETLTVKEDLAERARALAEEKSLDREQGFARNYMENTTENVFVTGKAGTGKSFLLDSFKLRTNKATWVAD